jgi:hypothetical protein
MHFHLPKQLHGWREFAGEVDRNKGTEWTTPISQEKGVRGCPSIHTRSV